MITIRLILLMLLTAGCAMAGDAKPPTTATFKILGLCYPERVEDLRAVMRGREDIQLVSVDYEHGLATFSVDHGKVSSENIGNIIGAKGFGIRPESHVPADHLVRVDIGVIGLDCKGCALGTYNAIGSIDGVERATVSYKEGRVTAFIDSSKTSQMVLEEALKKANVTLTSDKKAP
jgi:copper chaperone CopZ